MTFETKRLLIRPYEKEDQDFCLSLWCDPVNGKYMSDPILTNADDRYLTAVRGLCSSDDGFYFVAELKSPGACCSEKETALKVGTCCTFSDETGCYDIGYCIHMDYWRQGLGSELIAGLIEWVRMRGGKSVSAEIADANTASRALAEKLGFSAEKSGSFRKWGEDTVYSSHLWKRML